MKFSLCLKSKSFASPSSMLFLIALLLSLACSSSVAGTTFFEQDCLDSHNSFRSRHGSQALFWNEAIAAGARNWSEFLLQNQSLRHDTSHNLGENLGFVEIVPAQPICNNASQSSCFRCSQIVEAWYNESSNYNFSEGVPIDPNKPYLHFTQLVWRTSNELGVGVASGGSFHYIVARYSPRGNVGGPSDYTRFVPVLQPTVPPTTQPITTGPPETTARPPNSTSPTTPPNITSASPTGPVASVSTPPDTTTPPPTTPPPPCNATRRTPLQEDRVNALTFTIANYTIEEWCAREEEFKRLLAAFLPGAEIFILPGFPVLNSPLQIRFYVRVASGNASISLDRALVTNILQSFLQNLTATFGVQFSVDGGFTNWGPWEQCSSTCGVGSQIRFRNCTNPPPSNNGSDCVGPRNETQACNSGPCPVPTTLPVASSPVISPSLSTGPETTARSESTSPTTAGLATTSISQSIAPSPTGPIPSVSTPLPPTTPPPPCNATRRIPSPEDRNNAFTFTIANYTIPQWCGRETEFKQLLVGFVNVFCNSSGLCGPTPGQAEVFILPGFPVLNSPLQIRFYVRVLSGNASISLDRALLTNILQSFLQNLTAAFGVQFAVDGGFTNWGPWERCSSTCGVGSQIRYRNCTNPPPINNGSDCVGPRNNTQACNSGPCPVTTTMPTPTSPATTAIPTTEATITQTLITSSPTTGPPATATPSVLPTTPRPCVLPTRKPALPGEFNNSVSIIIRNIDIQQWCRLETQFKQRLALFVTDFCSRNPAQCAKVPITPSDEDLINILPGYPIQYNPVEVRFYVRVKTGPNAHLPLDKDVLLLIFQSFLRNVSDTLGVQISVDGNFTNWGPWGPCSSSCGAGTQVRYRNCTNPPPINNGSDCVGPRSDTQACDSGPCPVDGNFTEWEQWSSCSESCGLGKQTRYRSCTNPPPGPGGRDCNGSRMETRDCQIVPCPIDGNYSTWGAWSSCSQSCGNGTQIRIRNCTNPPPQFGGRDCVGPRNETQDCYAGPCPVDGNFTEWGAWGACSKSCGNGTEVRIRNCTNPPPAFGGQDCTGPRNESRPCFARLCPVDGNFTTWTQWGQCSRTCGVGVQTRFRSCINPPPSNGGRDCAGPRNETQQCQIEPCAPRLYAHGLQVNDTKLPNFNTYRYYCRRINIRGIVLPFFAREHRKVYVCRNGLLRFLRSNVIRWPVRFPGTRNEDGIYRFQNSYVIAPYWAYINHNAFRVAGNRASAVYYHVYRKDAISTNHEREIFNRANNDVQRYQTNPRIPLFDASWILVVTWVRIYPNTYPSVITANTFQTVLMTDGQHTFSLFNYPENGIEWSTPTGGRFRQFWQNARGLPVAGYNAGDRASLRFNNLPNSGTVDIDMIDQRLGSANEFGIWHNRLDANPILDLPGKKCYDWYRQQANVRIPQLPPCPCTFNQATLDKRFFVDYSGTVAIRSNQTICAYSIPVIISRWVQQCCYTDSPGGGKVLVLGPREGGGPFLIGLQGSPGISDLKAHDYCCNSSLCALYYQRRPSRNCNGFSLRRRGLIWGDPHFSTLDNKTYTFNGLGEYTMVVIDNGVFEMQARTKRTSGRGLGTVFSAAAAKEQDAAVVEGRINNNGELEVLVAGSPYDISIVTPMGTYIPDANITLIRDSDGTTTVLFPSEISFIFANVDSTLAIAFDGPEQFKNRTKGLLGTWNDNPSDDFLAPDGTLLPADATPQQIHYEFGLKWQIRASRSLFTYTPQQNPASFIDLSYVPMFIDNITWTNDSFRLQAEKVCGNNTNCLFDAAVTVDTSYGMATKKLEENNNEVNRELANFPPKMHGPQVMEATINQTIEFNITAEHNSSDYFVFTVENFPNVEIVANTTQYLVIRWHPTSTEKIEPILTVTDSKGSSSELRPLILLCPCKNDAQCIEDDDVRMQRESGARFIVLSCRCPAGLTGQNCESNVDACLENNEPCFPGVKCINLKSSGGTGYKCGPCPAGYRGDGATCDDIDECTANISTCSQLCINTPGSYLCDCNQGYNLNSDSISCRDIDECAVSNDCMQQCTNYPGGRSCSCFEGFQVDPVDNTACIPVSRCNVTKAAGCQQVCREDHGQPKCSCRKGYELNADGKTCDDINECTTHKHRCSQLCHNTDGSYTCSCLSGYSLAPDHMTCNDIDECGLIDVVNCGGSLELCINTMGSFYCKCQDGFQRINNTCEEFFPTTGPPSTSTPTSSAKTNVVAKEGINSAVAMTIGNADLHEWHSGLSQVFKDVVARVAVAYCEQDKKANCYNAVVMKRSIGGESLAGRVQLLNHFPQERDANLLVAFYVILHTTQGEYYVMNRDALLQALKESSAALSSLIKKEVYNIRAYHEDEGSPPPRESQIDESQTKWIIIGASVAVTVVMVIVIVVLCRRQRRILCELDKQARKTEFVLRQWAGTPEETVFLGMTNSTTSL